MGKFNSKVLKHLEDGNKCMFSDSRGDVLIFDIDDYINVPDLDFRTDIEMIEPSKMVYRRTIIYHDGREQNSIWYSSKEEFCKVWDENGMNKYGPWQERPATKFCDDVKEGEVYE